MALVVEVWIGAAENELTSTQTSVMDKSQAPEYLTDTTVGKLYIQIVMHASWIRRESPLPNISTQQPTLLLYGPLLHIVVVVYRYI